MYFPLTVRLCIIPLMLQDQPAAVKLTAHSNTKTNMMSLGVLTMNPEGFCFVPTNQTSLWCVSSRVRPVPYQHQILELTYIPEVW
jgi:hypothetical protein